MKVQTPKPKIEEVFTAFQQFQNDMISRMPSKYRPLDWRDKAQEHRNTLRDKLHVMGLGEFIDWTEK